MQVYPKVHLIWWGTNWTGSAAQAQATSLVRSFNQSAYQQILTQYDGSHGSTSQSVDVTSWTDTSVAAPSVVSDHTVQNEVINAIASTGWQRITDAQFIVLAPPGSTYASGFGSGSGAFCGYHGVDGHGSSYAFVPYASGYPFGTVDNCEYYDHQQPGNADDALSVTLSHEYAETVNDPIPLTGWLTSDGYEIGDLCVNTAPVTVPGAAYAQQIWSNRFHACTGSGYAHDWNGDGSSDVIARQASDGTLLAYYGNGSGGWLNGSTPAQIGNGWEGYDTLLAPGDWNGDGYTDILARRASDGALLMFEGNGQGGWLNGGSPVQIGNGWDGFDQLVTPGDWNGDGHADLIARRASDGALFLYEGNGLGGWLNGGNPVQIGTGWQGYDLLVGVGDFNGDGHPDLIGRRASDGALFLYEGDGQGGWLNGGNPLQVGTGWDGFDALVAAGDFNGDGHPDLIARRASDGALFLYEGDGRGGWLNGATPVLIGTGWGTFDSLVGL